MRFEFDPGRCHEVLTTVDKMNQPLGNNGLVFKHPLVNCITPATPGKGLFLRMNRATERRWQRAFQGPIKFLSNHC
jgi:hypothetical protein